MIPPKTLNALQSSQQIKRFRDCPNLSSLPYATYGSAHQITLAAEILSAALYWRAGRFRALRRSSSLSSKPIATETNASPVLNLPQPESVSLPQPLETPGVE